MEGVKHAKSITRVLFGTDISSVNADEVLVALSGDPRLVSIPADEMHGTTVLRLTVNHGVTKSTSTLPLADNVVCMLILPPIFHRRCEVLSSDAWPLPERPDDRCTEESPAGRFD